MSKKILSLILSAMLIIALAGCDKSQNEETSSQNQSQENSEFLEHYDMFTARDKEIGYDESTATKINLDEKPDGVTITAEGTYILTGKLENGQVVVDADKTAKIQLVLDGVNINCDTSASIYIKQADKVFITLANGSKNTLSNKTEFVAIDDNNIDGVIFSKDDLTLNGAGMLTINANYGNGIVSKDDLVITSGEYVITSQNHALEGKDCVKISDGNFTLTSGKDGIHAENSDDTTLGYLYIAGGHFDITAETDAVSASSEICVLDGNFNLTTGGGSENASMQGNERNMNWGRWGGGRNPQAETVTTETSSAKALKATNIVIKGGNFDINSSDDSIHANGNLEISGGIFAISSGDDGIHADNQVVISGGEFNITKSYEGIEGQSIKIAGGNITLVASDDGLNSAGGNDQSAISGRPGMNPFEIDEDAFIEISGGVLKINASGDGIDSNGDLTITGGKTFVAGPTNSGNGALDYAGSATISNGIFVATGMSGMAMNFSSNSTQGAMLVNFNSTTNGDVILKDSAGAEIIAYSPNKQYNSVVISHPQIKVDETYTLTAGENSQDITMTSLVYGGGMGGFGGGGMRNPMPNGERPEKPNGEKMPMPEGEAPYKPDEYRGVPPKEVNPT